MAGRKGRSGGRNSKTRAEHRLAGTHRQDRHGRKRPPEPTPGTPDAPAILEGAALSEWKRMVALLKTAGVLTVVDGAMLFHYCEMHGQALDIRAQLRAVAKRERVRLSDAKRVDLEKQQLKLWAQWRAYGQAIRMYLVEFGLSPSSRSRVALEPVDGEDAFARFDVPPQRSLVPPQSDSPPIV